MNSHTDRLAYMIGAMARVLRALQQGAPGIAEGIANAAIDHEYGQTLRTLSDTTAGDVPQPGGDVSGTEDGPSSDPRR